MNRQQRIEDLLGRTFQPAHLEVVDESSGHNVPAGAETHFKVTVVSTHFDGKALVARHRAVNSALSSEFAQGLHALAVHAYTPAQWAARGGPAPASPKCRGGMKKEAQRATE